MPKSFNFSDPPFDCLTPAEQELVRSSLDIAFFAEGEQIIGTDVPSEHLYVVIKGYVEERDGEDVVAICGPDDVFDARGLVMGDASHNSFVVREEAICYVLPKSVVLDLTKANAAYGAYFYQDLSQKLSRLSERSRARELNWLMMARVRDAYIHPAYYVEATDTVRTAGREMRDRKVNALIVRNGARSGIVTGMNLTKALVLDEQPLTAPIGDFAHFDLVTVRADEFLYNALILMTRHSIRRVVVVDEDDQIIGTLDEIDLLSFLSSHSHLISVQLERAHTLDEMKAVSARMDELVASLHVQGVKIQFIADLVTELNRKLMAKLFHHLATPEIVENTCLVVMGSEGRGEQILRTDQDNGLILRDGVEIPGLEEFCGCFSQGLLEFGYPPCPGNVMVTNPEWTRPLSGFRQEIYQWIRKPSGPGNLNLAIFYDAIAVAGDASLLDTAKSYMFDLLADNDAFYAHFARTTEAFQTPLGLFFNLIVQRGDEGDMVDLKKGGIFPIVHGIRSLALQQRLKETGTIARIGRLRGQGIIDRALAEELIEAFNFMMGLRLKSRLARIAVRKPYDNLVNADDLSTVERDLLKDALYVVKRAKDLVRHHFHLGLF